MMGSLEPGLDLCVAIDGLVHIDHRALAIQIGAPEREQLPGARTREKRRPAHSVVPGRQGSHEGANLGGGNRPPRSRGACRIQPWIARAHADSVSGVPSRSSSSTASGNIDERAEKAPSLVSFARPEFRSWAWTWRSEALRSSVIGKPLSPREVCVLL